MESLRKVYDRLFFVVWYMAGYLTAAALIVGIEPAGLGAMRRVPGRVP